MGLNGVPIKIDSGAYTSTIHCNRINEINNELHCFFKIGSNQVEVVFNNYQTKTVVSSNGQKEERYLVKSNINLFKRKYKINLTLSKRSSMRYPVLLGRKFLKGKFIIDVSKKDLSLNNK